MRFQLSKLPDPISAAVAATPSGAALYHAGITDCSGRDCASTGVEALTPGGLVPESLMSTATQNALADVDGWPINVATEADAIAKITRAAGDASSFAVFTLNLDHLVKLRTSAAFRKAYRAARYVTADGEPVARLARRQAPSVERTTGADLLVPLAKAAADQGLPVYLFGTSPDVIGRAADDLAERCGGRLDIAGSAAPAMGFDPEGPQADAALDKIASSGARLCFVALGAPKQEIFAARAVERGVKAGFVCIGAALDFIAGEQSRAPLVMQRNGLEWLWRLATSPRRLAGRYLSCALVLADIVIFGSGRRNPQAKRFVD